MSEQPHAAVIHCGPQRTAQQQNGPDGVETEHHLAEDIREALAGPDVADEHPEQDGSDEECNEHGWLRCCADVCIMRQEPSPVKHLFLTALGN